MKARLTKVSILIKILLTHVIVLAIGGGTPLLIVAPELIDSSSKRLMLGSLFSGIFFMGALILGIGGVLRSAISVSRHLLRKDDLNSQPIREEIKLLIFFSGEIVLAVVFFVSVAWLFPDVIDLEALFQSIQDQGSIN
jgi:Ca2+/Na+ antiporter